MCSRSSSRLSSHGSSQRQPCEHGSWPASRTHSPTSGTRSYAIAQPNIVIGILNESIRRWTRQMPARLPYS